MKILFALTYYRPHISGLTIATQRFATGLARRGHRVTVLTSQHEKGLLREETIDGVKIVRVPVLLRISKGVIMPRFPFIASRLIARNQVVSIELPYFEAALVSFLARLFGKKVFLTYNCNLSLPAGVFNALADKVIRVSNHFAAILSKRIITYTEDYARHCPFLRRFWNKLSFIYPPIILPAVDHEIRRSWKKKYNLNGFNLIGFAGRFAAEKGMRHLFAALPEIMEKIPKTKIVFMGEYKYVFGETVYRELLPRIDRLGDKVIFLGAIPDDQVGSFYSLCDCLVLPSINSTESFGMVQVEAMLAGTPVVASDLPGVRVPVRLTGMGEAVPPGDHRALAGAVIRVLSNQEKYRKPAARIREIFSPGRAFRSYQKVLEE